MASSQSLLVLAWVLLSFALQFSNGLYRPEVIIFLCSAWVATGAAVWAKSKGREPNPERELREIGVALCLAIALSYLTPLARFLLGDWYQACWRIGAAILLTLTITTLLTGGARSRFFPAAFFFGLLFAFTMRFAVLVASPQPLIDVFAMSQDSARHLVEGFNPYSTPVSDIYSGHPQFQFGYKLPGYVYPPLNLLPAIPFWLLFHDVRVVLIFAEIVAAAAMYAAGRGGAAARWAILLFLFMPRGIFIIEQSWTEPLIVMGFALTSLIMTTRPDSRWLSVCYGLMLGLKQYLVFFILHGLMIERRPARLALTAVAAAAPFIPFLLWDWRALANGVLFFHLDTPFRPDGLTLSSLIFRNTGVELAKWVAFAVGSCCAAICFIALPRGGAAAWRLAAIFTTFSILLVGSQAFANYYYFVAAMMTIHLAAPEAATPTTQA